MKNRAYSVLSVKSIDEDKRIIRGVATTPSVDRVGDIIEPEGVKFENPMPLLWQHQHDQPIGHTTFGKPTKSGIPFEAEFVHPDAVESATLKDRLQMAWDSVKTQLVRAVSIGFRPIEYAFMDNGGIRYSETEVYELSAVTIPANADAVISTIKSMDAAARKEAGVPDPEIPEAPKDEAATGKKFVVVKLDAPARDRAPFVINKIHTERKRAHELR
jgi:HK97 family phage prohead protease